MSEDVVGNNTSSSTSGVWEQSAGLRWQLVGEQEERIPSRSRSSSRRDGPVDPGLSIQVMCVPLQPFVPKVRSKGFLDSFTEEEAVAQEGSSIVYHSDGNMLARYLEENNIKRLILCC